MDQTRRVALWRAGSIVDGWGAGVDEVRPGSYNATWRRPVQRRKARLKPHKIGVKRVARATSGNDRPASARVQIRRAITPLASWCKGTFT